MTVKSDRRVLDYCLIKSDYEDRSGLMYKKLRLLGSYITSGGNLLDFGTGTGELIDSERHKFDHIYGIDSDERSISICEERFAKDRNIHICQSNGNDLIRAIGDTRFDCIVASDVLEHVQLNECIKLLQVFYYLLNIGGKFFFTGPGMFEKVRIIAGQGPHVHSHSSYGWARIINEAGFHIVSVESVEFPIVDHALLRKRLHIFGRCCVIQARKDS